MNLNQFTQKSVEAVQNAQQMAAARQNQQDSFRQVQINGRFPRPA